MIFFSLGLSSSFAEWCDTVTARLVEESLGDAALLAANTLGELALAAIKARASHIVVSARQPIIQLCKALSEANRGFLVTLDDPRLALHDFVVGRGLDLVEATRMVASSCASMVSCISIPGALVLRANQWANDRIGAAVAIAAHLKLPVAPEDVARIADGLAASPSSPQREQGARWWDQLEGTDRTLVDGALGGYLRFFNGGELGPIAWERDLFFMAEASIAARAMRPIDITGKSRVVLWGPYISLPPGSWSANIALGFSPDAAEMSYVVEVVAGADRQLTHVRIHPHDDRFVETNLSFSVDESVDQTIEIRVQTERAAFDGRLALGHVTITPHLHMRSETQDYLERVLSE